MTSEYIFQTARRVLKKYEQRDPARLAAELGFLVLYQNMGGGEDCCKGFCIRQSRVFAIVVNGDMPGRIRRLVIAHEIGHALLHQSELESGILKESSVFDSGSLMEYQADMFAAEYLISDADALELQENGLTVFQAARELGVPEELFEYKLRSMKNRGQCVCAPENARSGFLKHIN